LPLKFKELLPKRQQNDEGASEVKNSASRFPILNKEIGQERLDELSDPDFDAKNTHISRI
jgi:hypothetical protein